MKKIFVFVLAVSLLLGCMLPFSLTTLAAESDTDTVDGVTTPLTITEVCFNPAYETNSLGIEVNADVFEFFEIYNVSDETVSLADVRATYSIDGYEGFEMGVYSESELYTLSTNRRELRVGEMAVVAVYGKETVSTGLGYDTDEAIQAYYDAFAAFYSCQGSVDMDNFYIVPKYESGVDTKIETSFNLTNTTEDVVLRLGKEGTTLAEAHYSSLAWNKNNTSLHMSWLAGMDPVHPEASVAFATGKATPGALKDNQMRETVLTPADGADTLAVRAMHYNVCSTECTQKNADGSEFSMVQRMEGVFAAIEANDADVIGLCEINYQWVPKIKEIFTTEEGGYSGFGMSSQGRLFSGDVMNVGQTWDFYNLIMWRTEKYNLIDSGYFWCSSTPDRANSYQWEDGTIGDFARCINWVILEDKETGADFFFMCAHIDAKSASVRAKSATLIRNKIAQIAGPLPVIVVGDWNCAENSSAYANIASGGIVDARYRVTDPADMTVRGTFNKWGANTDIGGRLPIDLCFVTADGVFVNSAHMDYGYYQDTQLYSSDHHATVYELEMLKKYLPEAEDDTEAPAEEETSAISEDISTEVVTEDVPAETFEEEVSDSELLTEADEVLTEADTIEVEETQSEDGTAEEGTDTQIDTAEVEAGESQTDASRGDAEQDGTIAWEDTVANDVVTEADTVESANASPDTQGVTDTTDGTDTANAEDVGCASVSRTSVCFVLLICILPVAMIRRRKATQA